MRTISPLRYIGIAAAVTAVLAVLAIGFNIYVDPYRMFGTDRLATKPEIYKHAALAKAYMLTRARPETLILGNARTEIGIDPGSAEWQAGMTPVFNAAEMRGSLFGAYRLLQHDLAVRPPEFILLGLDFADFVEAGAPPSRMGADERRLLAARDGHRNPDAPLQMWRDFFMATLTTDSLADSVHTLFAQNDPFATTMTADGFNPLRDYVPAVRRSGAYKIFMQNEAHYAAQLRSQPMPDFRDAETNLEMRHLGQIVRLAVQNDVQIIVFIQPYHARYLEMLHGLGLWPSFVAWKHALLSTIDEAAGDRRGLVQLFDFTDYDDTSTEPVPPPGETKTAMRWYLDPTHYSPELGDLLIACMLGAGPVIGAKIDDTTIDEHLNRIDAHRLLLMPKTAAGKLRLTARDQPPSP